MMARKKKKNSILGWIVAIGVGIASLITGKDWMEWDTTQEIIRE